MTEPVKDPHAVVLITSYLDHNGHVIILDDGKPMLRMTRKQALHHVARLAVTLAEGAKDE